MTRQLGDAQLTALPVLAVIPVEVLENALSSATRGTRGLSETEKAQWRPLMSAVRVKYGASPLYRAGSTSAVAATPDTAFISGGTGGATKLKLKMSQIIDQGGVEVEVLSGPVLRKKRAKYALVEGDIPLDKEEASEDGGCSVLAEIGSSVHAASVCGVPKQRGHTLGSYGRCKGRVLIQMCVSPTPPHPTPPHPTPPHPTPPHPTPPHPTPPFNIGILILDMSASRSERH